MSTIEAPERVSSFLSNKSANTTYSRSSVYQTNGKPLSEEAIYKAKLKYGVYNKPGAPVVGVENTASDSAALLATQTDLSVHPYKRDLSSEAATAALIAKTDSAPKAWKRENFAPDAEYAAISAGSIKFPFNGNITHDDKDSSDAASSVLKKNSSTIAREALEDLYAFDDIRNGTHTFTQFDGQSLKTALESSVAYSLSKRTNPTLDYRSGLTTKGSQMRMNLGDVHKQSSLNASRSMTLRITPDHNVSRAGLNTKKLDYANGEIDISKINLAANASARKSLINRMESGTKDYRSGIQTASDLNSKTLAASSAGLSLSNPGFADYASRERESLKHNTLVNKNVYAVAAANAERSLAAIETETTTKNMFHNREMNIKAIQIAQANLLKRNENSGKINLGGGLLMDPLELQLLAASIVKPVLTDIDSKAIAQRKNDHDRAKQNEELKQKRIEQRQEQKRLKLEAIAKREEEKKAKKIQLQKDKDLEIAKQTELTKKKTDEVKAKNKDLSDKTTEEDAEKEALLSEKLEGEKKIEEEETLKKTERDGELQLIQDEKDEDVAPILEEYNKETALLDELIAKREAAEKLAKEQSERVTAAETELNELNTKLEETSLEIEKIKEELTTIKLDSEKHSTEAELHKKEAEAEVESKLLKEQEFITNSEKLLSEKSDLQAKRAAALVSLHEAKKAALLEELAIHDALPEHLQKDVNQDLSEESDIDEDQFNTTDEEPEEVPTAEQEKIPETPTKTVVEGDEVKSTKKIEKETPKKSLSKTTKLKPAVKKTVESPTSPSKRTWKSRMKALIGTTPNKPTLAPQSSPKKATTQSSPKKTTTTSAKPVSKSQISDPLEVAKPKEEKNELKQTFSGFSQGSIPGEDDKKKETTTNNGGDEDTENDNDSVLNESNKDKELKDGLFKEDI